jgi:hypothetical protein
MEEISESKQIILHRFTMPDKEAKLRAMGVYART